MDYSKYIIPIISITDGSGVVVGDLLITAGHVVDTDIKLRVVIGGRCICLSKDDALLFDTNPDKRSDGIDIAVFRLTGISSPLKLSEVVPNEGEYFLSCSIRHTSSRNTGQTSNIFCTDIKEELIFEQRRGKAAAHYGNYFECYFTEPLSRGSSGSPLLDGDKVVGILYGDKEGKNSSHTVLFLSADVILKMLNVLEK